MTDVRLRKALLLSVGLIWGGPPLAAAELGISGNYGNDAGCRLAKSGGYHGDDILLLTPTSVQTYATLCSFVQIVPAEADNQVAMVTCAHEGDELTTLGLMRMQKSQDSVDAYLIFDENGTMWGKAERC